MKTCKTCSKEKLEEQFYKSSRNAGGLKPSCKECYDFYRKSHKYFYTKVQARANARIKEQKASCYVCKTTKSIDAFYKCKTNPSGIDGKCKQCSQELVRKNAERISKYYSNRNKIRKKEDPKFRLVTACRSRLNSFLHSKDVKKTIKAKEYIGCSLDFLKVYLESKFQPGMTWENYGRNGWHLDHIYPLSRVDLSSINHLKSLLHFTNLQPLWERDNLSKGNKI